MADASAIYQGIYDECEQLTLGGPLGQNISLKVAGRIACTPAELRSRLRNSFDAEELVGAGAMYRPNGGNSRVELVPALAKPGPIILPTRLDWAYPPSDLVTDHGCLSGIRLPFHALLNSRPFKGPKRHLSEIMICSTLPDCVALTQLGLTCTTSFGLEALGGRALDRVCKALNWDRWLQGKFDELGQDIPSEPVCYALVFVASQLTDGGPPALGQLKAATANFWRLRRNLQVAVSQVYVWQPDDNLLKKFSYVLRFGTPQEAKNKLLQSTLTDSRPLFKELVPPEPSPSSMASGFRKLRGHERDDFSDRTTRGANFVRQLEVEIVAKLLEQADQTTDPIRKNQITGLAALSYRFLASAFSSPGRPQGLAALWLPAETLRNGADPLLAQAEQIRRLTQDLYRYGH